MNQRLAEKDAVYRIASGWHWYFLYRPYQFDTFRLVEDRRNRLGLSPSMISFRQSDNCIWCGRGNDRLIQTELAMVKREDDRRVRIRLNTYINVVPACLIRFHGWTFTVNEMTDEDYLLLKKYEDGTLRFFHRL